MIGKMDQVVTVYTSSLTDDEYGGSTKLMTSIGQYFAEVKHLSGDEREHALRDADKQSLSFTMHNFQSFPASTTSQIEWNCVRYDVVDREYIGQQRLYITFKAVSGELN